MQGGASPPGEPLHARHKPNDLVHELPVRRGIPLPRARGGLTPDYDSPLLLERFRALLNAFSAWLDGNVTGTQIKRRDVRVSFPDAKGIEHPLCLSNYGRRASDGSYLLGTLAPRH